MMAKRNIVSTITVPFPVITVIVIPARMDSKRFPGKPLAMIASKPMITRVFEQCKKVKNADFVVVATNSKKIANVVGVDNAAITGDHKTGSDRIAELAKNLPENAIVVNVQGDMPFVNPLVVEQLINKMKSNPRIDICTPVKPCGDVIKWKDKNCVKALFDQYDNATVFYRSPRSFKGEFKKFWKHIGIYSYRNQALQKFSNTKEGFWEKVFRLEQYRLLSGDFCFKILKTKTDCGQDVNTPQDLELIQGKINEHEKRVSK